MAALESIGWFALIISIIVFIHELGHYIAARLCGVKIETFSIGCGPELLGFVDKHGTRWRLAILLIGGYVKMNGEEPGSYSNNGQSFQSKKLLQKIFIVSAGCIFNYLLAIFILAGLVFYHGKSETPPYVESVVADTPAAEYLESGDIIISIDGREVTIFEDIRANIALNKGEAIEFIIARNNKLFTAEIVPQMRAVKTSIGEEIKLPVLGIIGPKPVIVPVNAFHALGIGAKETYRLSSQILKGLGEILTRKRSLDEIGGPVKIAQYSSQSASHGLMPVLFFIALLSINLGLINLLPIPVLDGGHLLFYILEGIWGKPLPKKFLYYSNVVGVVILMMLMMIGLSNDVKFLMRG
jgi:regulator of sigma E protease